MTPVASGALDDLSQRSSEADRERAVAALRDDLVAGRLTLDEFSERVELAYRARTGEDLAALRQGLPEPARARRRPTRLTAALFAHVVRRGRLRLRRRTVALAAVADIDLDLRDAEMDDAEPAVVILALLGNVDLYVPEGIEVDVAGVTVFGHRREWGNEAIRAGAPIVRVRTLGLFATVDVWRVPRGLGGDYGEIMRRLESDTPQLT
jgi:uncharacterized protein DUF1707/cell wall-active antibiotic response 4TMS protein YvqF